MTRRSGLWDSALLREPKAPRVPPLLQGLANDRAQNTLIKSHALCFTCTVTHIQGPLEKNMVPVSTEM
jgi:hypothetical protein